MVTPSVPLKGKKRKRKTDTEKFNAKHPIVAKKIDKALEDSKKEGALSSVSANLGLSYLSPFALILNATASQVGILQAFSMLLPSVVQLGSCNLLRRFTRKKIMLTSILLQTLLWIPIMLVGALFFFGFSPAVWILIVLVGLFYLLGGIAIPVWFSWIGSIVPKEKRGSYFSSRNRIHGFFGLISVVLGALILDSAKKIGAFYGEPLGFTLLGFGILFSFAFMSRILSIPIISNHYDPKLHLRKKDYFSLKEFFIGCRKNAFGRFVLYKGALSLAMGISAPFWAVYMLRDLNFSYLWFIAITVSTIASQLLFLPVLGKASDRFGNVAVLKLCSSLLFLVPLIWYFSSFIQLGWHVFIYLLIIPSIISGFALAGYNLATNNYVFDAISGGGRRSFAVSYMNLVVGVSLFLGAGIGSLIAWLNPEFMNPILFIFLVSASLRFLVSLFGLKYLSEVRHVKKFTSNFIFREFQPVEGAVREIHHLEHIVDKIEHEI